MPTLQIPGQRVSGFDLKKYLRLARRRGPLVAAITILVTLLGTYHALQLTSVYTAKATMLLDAGKQNVINTEAVLAGPDAQAYGALESQMELMRSRDVVRRAVEKLKLGSQPAPPPTTGGFRQLLQLMWSGETERDPVKDAVIESDPLERAINQVQGGMAVSRRGFSFVVDLKYTDVNPAMAAAIANALADEYLVDQLEAKYDATKRAT